MNEDRKQRFGWERRFPPVDDEWTHWWIEGDGALLAVVAAADLNVALDIVARHHKQVLCIVAHAAKVDAFGEVVRDEKRRCAITEMAAGSSASVAVEPDGRCCLCARALVSGSDVIALIERPFGGPALCCHDECIRSMLHSAVVDDGEPDEE